MQGHDPLRYLSKTDLLPLCRPTSTVYKQDITQRFRGQLTELADFDYLLAKSHTKTDGDDARADDLTRRRSNKRPKTKSIQKAAERV